MSMKLPGTIDETIDWILDCKTILMPGVTELIRQMVEAGYTYPVATSSRGGREGIDAGRHHLGPRPA
jgi:hypothetical protein